MGRSIWAGATQQARQASGYGCARRGCTRTCRKKGGRDENTIPRRWGLEFGAGAVGLRARRLWRGGVFERAISRLEGFAVSRAGGAVEGLAAAELDGPGERRAVSALCGDAAVV